MWPHLLFCSLIGPPKRLLRSLRTVSQKSDQRASGSGAVHFFPPTGRMTNFVRFSPRWKSGVVCTENGGGITMIPPPRALRRAYTVSYRETKNPNPLPTANRFGFSHFGGDKRDRTADLLNAIQALSQLSYTPISACPAKPSAASSRCYFIRASTLCQQ